MQYFFKPTFLVEKKTQVDFFFPPDTSIPQSVEVQKNTTIPKVF